MVDVAWLILVGAVGLVLAGTGAFLAWRSRHAQQGGLSVQLLQRVRALVAEGRAMEAIMLLRRSGGRGLREATELVESLVPPPRAEQPLSQDVPPGPNVERLLRQRRFLEAVRAYQDQTGLDAQAAREVVERLRNGIN